MYGDLDNICMVTLAPEIPNATSVIGELCKRNIKVSIGKKRIRGTLRT
jgi:N-acetylglucosamine-6-phosphate deacetylase